MYEVGKISEELPIRLPSIVRLSISAPAHAILQPTVDQSMIDNLINMVTIDILRASGHDSVNATREQ
jgi:hypothetical protein